MNLEELLKGTDALTYINSLKVTLTEIKEELSTQEELSDYLVASRERTRKLIRKADNQYRLVTKLVTRDTPVSTTVSVQQEVAFDELEELMSE